MPINCSKKTRAFSLIEILITVLVVNFGILGLVKLQLLNHERLNNSILSLKAAYYSETLVEKMLGNVDQAKSSNSPYVLNDFTNTPSEEAVSDICVSSSCTSSQLAIYDMNSWLYKIKNNLPKGKAKVVKTDDGSNAIYTITVQWQYKSEVKSYELVAQL